MTFRNTLLGVTSMAASLGAIGFLLFSDVAVAEERAPAPQAQSAVQGKDVKAKAKPRRKRIDLGRFEGY